MLSPANRFFENWLRIHKVMGYSKWLNSMANEAEQIVCKCRVHDGNP